MFRDGVSDISYELVRGCSFDEGEPVVTLLPSGDIFTAGFNGHAVVMVTAHETDLRLNQSLIIHVEVRDRDTERENYTFEIINCILTLFSRSDHLIAYP